MGKHPDKLKTELSVPKTKLTTPTFPRTSEVTTITSRVKEIEDAGETLVKTGSFFEDTSELKVLVGQLSKTLEFLKVQEEEKRRRQAIQQELRKNEQLVEDVEEEPELLYLNIWNKVYSELKLTG